MVTAKVLQNVDMFTGFLFYHCTIKANGWNLMDNMNTAVVNIVFMFVISAHLQCVSVRPNGRISSKCTAIILKKKTILNKMYHQALIKYISYTTEKNLFKL